MGDKEANKHAKDKQRAGRGTVGKIPVAGVRDRNTGQGFLQERIGENTLVYTDEHAAYRGLPHHETLRHSVGEFMRGEGHFNGIKAHWSLLKRGFVGVYH